MSSPEGAPAGRPRRVERPSRRRLIAGVCSGLGDHFGVDPILLRIAFVGLAIFGGVGVWLYLAIFLLVPEEGASRAPIGLRGFSWRIALGVGVAIAAIAFALDRASHAELGTNWGIGTGLSAIALLGLLAGALWARLRRPALDGQPSSADRKLVRRVAFVTALACAFALLAVAGAGVAGIDRHVAAWIVVASGAAVFASAFTRHRWVIPAALVFAVPVAVVAAAGVDLSGGLGERTYQPLKLADVRGEYKLGAGRLEVDLRDIAFTPGARTLHVRLGAGELVILVPDSVSVQTHARVGGGYVGALDREAHGLDVNWSSRVAPQQGVPVLNVQARVGLGALFVADRPVNRGFEPGAYGTNAACTPQLGARQ